MLRRRRRHMGESGVWQGVRVRHVRLGFAKASAALITHLAPTLLIQHPPTLLHNCAALAPHSRPSPLAPTSGCARRDGHTLELYTSPALSSPPFPFLMERP